MILRKVNQLLIRIVSVILSCLILFSPTTVLITSEAYGEDIPKFSNITEDAGINSVFKMGHTAVWGDYNADGMLDIVIANYGMGFRRNYNRKIGYPNLKIKEDINSRLLSLWAGQKDNKLKDVSSISGLPDLGVRAASWADYNNDGHLDLAIGTLNAGKPLILYENVGGISFIDISKSSGITNDSSSVNHVLWADYDNDGYVDLFQAGYECILFSTETKETESLRKLLILPDWIKQTKANGAVWFDSNNDGFQDLFIANSGLNMFYVNNGNGTFTDATVAFGAWR